MLKDRQKEVEQMVQIVKDYQEKYHSLTDTEVGEMRTELSIILLNLSHDLLRQKHAIHNKASVNYENIRSIAYQRALDKTGTTTGARETYRSDKEYLKRMYERDEAKSDLDVTKTLIEQANQVLHAMASRIRN